MNIASSVAGLIGGTPLLRIDRFAARCGISATLLAKVEGLNPSGSVKDRAALSMVLNAEEKGLLQPGATIIEPTSGNTGIGLASIAASRGYRLILTMPDTMSAERRALLAAYGAQLVLTEGAKGMNGAIAKAQELHAAIPGSFLPGQFDNEANAAAHYAATGPEIWRDTGGRLDAFVAGIGTGGTITGAGRYLKEQNAALHIAAVEPAGSPVLSGGKPGPHKLQGIGAGFVPRVLDGSVYDEVIQITDGAAFEAGKALARTEGLLAGISSGAALAAAAELARRPGWQNKTIVVLLPDNGDRYLSTPLFAD